MPIYKIKNIKTGLYSTGGTTPRWRKEGKTWTAKQYVRAHITLVYNWYDYYKNKEYCSDITFPYLHDCVVEEYNVTLNRSITIFPPD